MNSRIWNRVLGRAAYTLGVGLLLSSQAVWGQQMAADPGEEAPIARRSVPFRLGRVDAPSGEINLRIPIGPKLPGRIPLGFTYAYDSLDPLHLRISGDFRPIVWPGEASNRLMYTIIVNGEPWNFFKNSQPNTPLNANWQSLLTQREGNDGYSDALNEGSGLGISPATFQSVYFPSGDGTKFFVMSWWSMRNNSTGIIGTTKGGRRYTIIDGANTIWASVPDANMNSSNRGLSHFQTLWGDHITVRETHLSYPQPTTYLYPNQLAINGTITIKNENATDQYITLAVNGNYSTATLAVTPSPSLNLPSASMSGYCTFQQRYTPDGGSTPVPENIWDFGFRPNSLTVTGDGEVLQTNFTWDKIPLSINSWRYQLNSINYPNTSKDAFFYECTERKQLGKYAFDPLTGMWMGFAATFQGTWPPPPPPATMVSRVVMQDSAGTLGNVIVLARTTPDWTSAYTWIQKDHKTTIYTFPTPSTSGSYRAVRLTHPSYNGPSTGTWGPPGSVESDMRNAYLFATSLVIQAEYFYGSGLSSFPGSGCETWTDSGYGTNYRTTTYQGWDVRSWGNPYGTIGTTLPVIPVATGIKTYETGLPNRVKVMGSGSSWDAWGPTQADSGATAPSGVSGMTGTSTGTWGGGSVSPASDINQMSKFTRSWNSNLMTLQTSKTTNTLQGSQLSSLRQSTASPLVLGTVDYGYDTMGRINSVKRTTNTTVTEDVRTFAGSNPQPQDITVNVTVGGTALPYSGAIGKSFGFYPAPHYWVASETDKLSGQTVSYVRDGLGRATTVTDPHGVVTQITYDGWGRVSLVTRNAKGSVSSLTTTYTYDPKGAWSTETTQGEGKTLTTNRYFDTFGRLIKVSNPDGSRKEFTYSGFGEKLTETPWLKAGQTNFGTFTWSYDSKGRVTKETDPKGRTLWTMPSDPAWNGSRVVATALDDRSKSISQYFDLLGQKTDHFDQKNQQSNFNYDKFGRMVKATLGSQVRSYTFDDLGWMLARSEPEEGTTNYSGYTAWGFPTVQTQTGRNAASTLTTTTTLDLKGRPYQVKDGSSGTILRTYAYDTTYPDQVSQITDTQPNGTLTETYGYDDLARLWAKTVLDETGQSFSISRSFDAFGNPTSLTYPAGGGQAARTLTNAYDAFNRLTDVTLGVKRGHMDYDQAVSSTSSTNTLTFGNGVTSSVFVDMGELKRITHSTRATPTSGLAALEDSALIWTAGGLLTNRGTDTFGYDELGRLTNATTYGFGSEFLTQTFSYDAYGNRTSTTATSNIALPAGAIPSWSAVFDTTNSLPTQVNISGVMTNTGVQYDNFGRVTQVQGWPGVNNLATKMTWTYDTLGRVVAENGTKFLLDGSGLRFRRLLPDGTVQYVVYGFERDPLSTFELAGPPAPKFAPKTTQQHREKATQPKK